MAVLTVVQNGGNPSDGVRERHTDSDCFVDAMTVGSVSGVLFTLGLRFSTVPVDLVQGSTIISAVLGYGTKEDSLGSAMTCRIRAERSATPAQMTPCTNSCSSVRSKAQTAAFVDAAQADFGATSLNKELSPLVQEVADDFDPSGNSFLLVLNATNAASGSHAVIFGSGSASGATLTVTYTPPGTGGVPSGPVTAVLSAMIGS